MKALRQRGCIYAMELQCGHWLSLKHLNSFDFCLSLKTLEREGYQMHVYSKHTTCLAAIIS